MTVTGGSLTGKDKPVKPASGGQAKLTVKIFSPFQLFYQGEAVSVSGVNKTGPFDILHDHANFFSLMSAGDVVVDTGFQRLKFDINHGIIKVSGNRATLFVDV
ncbi:hypothetical protein KY386_02865 [Candidatus Parcubacteria bacterium]|nr:hypothetical protein [Candidatus Parcubacteria bacterium]